MGADMVLASIGFKATDRFVCDLEQATEALSQARRAIESLDQTRFEAINNDSDTYAGLEECRKTLLEDIAAVEEALVGYRRDGGMVPGGNGIILLISGGPSWGDPPTELYASIARLADAEVMPDARWQIKQ